MSKVIQEMHIRGVLSTQLLAFLVGAQPSVYTKQQISEFMVRCNP